MYHAICLFTLPAFAGYSFSLTTEGGLRLSISLGVTVWFFAEMVYLSKDDRPPRH